MRIVIVCLMLGAAAAGCSGGNPPAPASAPPVEAPAPLPEDVMENVNLELWPPTDVPGEGVKPLLSIHAKRVTGMGGDTNVLSFEEAEAVVSAREEGDLEIHFEAKQGSFVEGERADLRGGVVARIDDMTITLEEISWEFMPGESGAASGGVAASDRPLRITSPAQNLEAASLRIYKATNTIELRDVTGEITFTGDTP